MPRHPVIPKNRIGVVDLQRETGANPKELSLWLKEAGVERRASDKSWPRKAAIAAVMARKSVPHMVAHRARGKVAGTITNDEAAALSRFSEAELLEAEAAMFEDEEPEGSTSGNTFAAAVGTQYSEMTKAKTASELERVRKLKLENDKAEGKIIDRASATATAKDIATRARSALLAIPRKAAPLLNGLTDEIEIAAILEAEIRHALQALANPDRYAVEVAK